ncbi:MAG TPA: radical SAM protein [Bacteroidales bacterium]|nr:radical SAM protein [Bacteroidales bacterium]
MIYKNLRIDKGVLKKLNAHRNRSGHVCNAPFVAMSVGYDAQVSPCCYTLQKDGVTGAAYYHTETLQEIWHGQVFANYRRMMKDRSLPPSCRLCREKLEAGDFRGVKIREFDHLRESVVGPKLIELNIENTCNLECIMCNTVNSSGIARKHGIAARVPDAADVLRQLSAFLPVVEEMIFSGGEPFLSVTYQRIWEELIQINPDCRITVNTNATVINSKTLALLEKGRFQFNVSLDSVQKVTYEKIRVNSRFETFFNNLELLLDYSRRKNVPLAAPVCPLVLNYTELPEILDFCNCKGIYLNFLHVFGAYRYALQSAPPEILEKALHVFSNHRLPETGDVEKHNAGQFNSLVSDTRLHLSKSLKRKKKLTSVDKNSNSFQQEMVALSRHTYFDSLQLHEAARIRNQIESAFALLPEAYQTGNVVNFFSESLHELPAELLYRLPACEIAEIIFDIFDRSIN